jgi:hypothetical protein
MNRIRVATEYSDKFLEIDRPSPLTDKVIEKTIQEVLSGHIDKDISNNVYDNFKREAHDWIFNSKLNNLTGIEEFNRIDIINGCTQFIDNIYMMNDNPPQTLNGDYRYHQRLNRCVYYVEPGSLVKNLPIIIAMPFPRIGAKHEEMDSILDEALGKNVDVHIDGAWVSCCRDIDFDFSHPAIKSVGISLSKGLGLGWNRIGLRYTRQTTPDSVTIMNDFSMNNRALSMIGLHFVRKFPSDYLWNTYGDIYHKVCNDFNLTPTKSIYLAQRDGQPVGVSPLIRYVAEQ